jgi:tetratricopeptide (TPR) repeat protein
MRATIAWSYERLSPDEQALFRRLAPFRGCRVEAARSVCVSEAHGPRATSLAARALDLDVRDGLESLLNKSLLRVEEDELGEARYVMLETVREFALEQLEASGEAPAISRRHTWWCLEFAEEVAPRDGPSRQGLHLGQLDRELGNFRVALDWCQAQGYAEPALRLASDLEWFWGARGRVREGRARLEALLARFPLKLAAGTRATVHARALLAAGRLAYFQLDFAAADQWLQRCLALCEQLEDLPGMCDALYGLATSMQERGDYAAARQAAERGLALCRGLAASTKEVDSAIAWRLGVGLVGLGIVAAMEGNSREALDRFQQSTAYLERIGQSALLASSAIDMGVAARESGGFEEARAFIEGALKLFEQTADQRGVALALAHLGDLSAADGDVTSARTYLRRSELVIGEATVATHVQHILRKLQLASRTEIAVWAERQHVSAGGQ